MADQFATRTATQIREGYLRDLRLYNPDQRVEQGSVEYGRGDALASQLLPIYANGVYLAKQAWPDTGSEETCAKFGSRYGVSKLGDQYSQGIVAVRGSFGTPIGDGAKLQNKSTGAKYKTVGITTIDPITLSGFALVVARQPGNASDAGPGVVLEFEGAPAGVDSKATVVSISGGSLAWSKAEWAVEILKRMRQAALAGNAPHIIGLGNSIPGVEQTFVYPALRGGGTMDVVILVSARSGTRVAGTDLINKVLGAVQSGATPPGGVFLGGVPEDVFRNTRVHAAVAQSTTVRVDFRASSVNAWEVWPPYGTGYVVPGNEATWYKVTGAPTSNTSFKIAKPASGTVVAPTVNDLIGVFFASHGYCKGKITSVADTGADWSVTVDKWAASNNASPTSALVAGALIIPWNAQLPNIAGAPESDESKELTGAVPAYYAALGPGEMTALTTDNGSRRRRWPRTTDTSPITGEVEWPTDVTSRLSSAILRNTDSPDISVTVTGGSTPTVPAAAYLGSPPSVLVLGTLNVIPTV